MSKGYSGEERERVIEHICEQLEEKRSLSKICGEDEGMPPLRTIMRWQSEDATVKQRIAHARDAYIHKLLDETIDIAEEASDDAYIWTDPKTKLKYARLDGSSVKRATLRIATRERYAQLMAPDRYGNKVDITSGGKALPAPSASGHDNRLDAILALALARRGQQPMIDVTPEPSLDDVMS
jgi:hypothetical protein